jgi:holo-[acyl-carrier protein] synthase
MRRGSEPDPRSVAAGVHVRVGVDLVAVDRVGRLLKNHPGAENRLFTEAERAYCRGKRRFHQHLAARVAAKEAVGKALGTGIGASLPWKAVEVLLESSGRPYILLHGEARRWGERHGLVEMDVSLSHTEELAVAYAVALVTAPPQTPS